MRRGLRSLATSTPAVLRPARQGWPQQRTRVSPGPWGPGRVANPLGSTPSSATRGADSRRPEPIGRGSRRGPTLSEGRWSCVQLGVPGAADRLRRGSRRSCPASARTPSRSRRVRPRAVGERSPSQSPGCCRGLAVSHGQSSRPSAKREAQCHADRLRIALLDLKDEDATIAAAVRVPVCCEHCPVSPDGIGGGQALGLLVVRGRIADELRHRGAPLCAHRSITPACDVYRRALPHGARRKCGEAPRA